MKFHLGRGDEASGTSQAMDAVAVSPVTCTGLLNSRSAGDVGPSVPCPKLGGFLT